MRFFRGVEVWGRRLKRKGCCQACWRRVLPGSSPLKSLNRLHISTPGTLLVSLIRSLSPRSVRMKKFVVKRVLVPRRKWIIESTSKRGGGRGRDFFRFDLLCKRARLRINLSSGTRIIRLEAGRGTPLKWMAKLGEILSPSCIF